MCGEKAYSLVISGSEWGSPPRMRGKVIKTLAAPPGIRITPAYAGKSCNSRSNQPYCKDHPRVCGEKDCRPPFEKRILGSPPHVRGKVELSHDAKGEIRITPAYAGKRAAPVGGFLRWWDHPRMCGEKQVPNLEITRSRGSPPHVRGKVVFQFLPAFGAGITPAYAGKRMETVAEAGRTGDHPRVCGEKPPSSLRGFLRLGSPPRMRGKAGAGAREGGRPGITPAYAGKSFL